jgi:hypothetical protein
MPVYIIVAVVVAAVVAIASNRIMNKKKEK